MTDTQILPYIEVDGIRSFPDSYILGLYDKIIHEGHGHMFQDGSIRDRDEFLSSMKYGDNFLWIVYHDLQLLGAWWLNSHEGRTARIHFCTFKGHDAIVKKKLVHEVMEYLIHQIGPDGKYLFDAFVGYLFTSNSRAIKYMEACGATIVGEIPMLLWNDQTGKSESGTIMYYVRSNDNENLH
jgi:hypothetical protein